MAIKVRYQNGSIKIRGENGLFKVIKEAEGGGGGGGINPEIYYDPGNAASYSGGSTLTNIGSLGGASGLSGTLSGVSYNGNVSGGVFNFDGTGLITLGQFNFGGQITVASWVYPRNKYSINTLVSNAPANLTSNGFKLEWNSWNTTDLKMLIEAGNGSSGDVLSSADAVVAEDQWQHLVWVINFANTTASLYKNGDVVQTTGGLVPNISRNNSNWYIGSMAGSYNMRADLGEVKIWLSSKSSSDISSEFNNTKSRYGF